MREYKADICQHGCPIVETDTGRVLDKADTIRTLNKQADEIRKLKSMCRAAAAEINDQWHWHCADDGYGPVNLMARLEGKLPPDLYPAFDDA